jgi:hypothetical protein
MTLACITPLMESALKYTIICKSPSEVNTWGLKWFSPSAPALEYPFTIYRWYTSNNVIYGASCPTAVCSALCACPPVACPAPARHRHQAVNYSTAQTFDRLPSVSQGAATQHPGSETPVSVLHDINSYNWSRVCSFRTSCQQPVAPAKNPQHCTPLPTLDNLGFDHLAAAPAEIKNSCSTLSSTSYLRLLALGRGVCYDLLNFSIMHWSMSGKRRLLRQVSHHSRKLQVSMAVQPATYSSTPPSTTTTQASCFPTSTLSGSLVA